MAMCKRFNKVDNILTREGIVAMIQKSFFRGKNLPVNEVTTMDPGFVSMCWYPEDVIQAADRLRIVLKRPEAVKILLKHSSLIRAAMTDAGQRVINDIVLDTDTDTDTAIITTTTATIEA